MGDNFPVLFDGLRVLEVSEGGLVVCLDSFSGGAAAEGLFGTVTLRFFQDGREYTRAYVGGPPKLAARAAGPCQG